MTGQQAEYKPGQSEDFLNQMAPILGYATFLDGPIPLSELERDYEKLQVLAATDTKTDDLTLNFRRDLLDTLAADALIVPSLRSKNYVLKAADVELILEDTQEWLYALAGYEPMAEEPDQDQRNYIHRWAVPASEIPVNRRPRRIAAEELAWSADGALLPLRQYEKLLIDSARHAREAKAEQEEIRRLAHIARMSIEVPEIDTERLAVINPIELAWFSDDALQEIAESEEVAKQKATDERVKQLRMQGLEIAAQYPDLDFSEAIVALHSNQLVWSTYGIIGHLRQYEKMLAESVRLASAKQVEVIDENLRGRVNVPRYPGGDCVGLEWIDLIPPNQALTAEAGDTCGDCPVRRCCAAYGFAHPEKPGIFGGYTEWQRKEEASRNGLCQELGETTYTPRPTTFTFATLQAGEQITQGSISVTASHATSEDCGKLPKDEASVATIAA